MSRWRTARLRLGRWLIHTGLKVMPHGRVRREITEVLEQWAFKVRVEIALREYEREQAGLTERSEPA